MNLELTNEEKEILRHAIEVYLSDLREEIYKTENHESKPPLKREEEVFKELLNKLS